MEKELNSTDVEGRIKSIAHGGKKIVVGVAGKEVKLKVSAKRTRLEGIKERSELKVGQVVAVEYQGDQASTISVKKLRSDTGSTPGLGTRVLTRL